MVIEGFFSRACAKIRERLNIVWNPGEVPE